MKIGNKLPGTYESKVVFDFHLSVTAEKIVEYYDRKEPSLLAYNSKGYFLRENPLGTNDIERGAMVEYSTAFEFLSQVLNKIMYDHIHTKKKWDKEIEFIIENVYQCLPSYMRLRVSKKRTDLKGQQVKRYLVSCPKIYKSTQHVGTYDTFMDAYIARCNMLDEVDKLRRIERDNAILSQTLKAPKGYRGVLGKYVS